MTKCTSVLGNKVELWHNEQMIPVFRINFGDRLSRRERAPDVSTWVCGSAKMHTPCRLMKTYNVLDKGCISFYFLLCLSVRQNDKTKMC